jgi:hypothetical protein
MKFNTVTLPFFIVALSLRNSHAFSPQSPLASSRNREAKLLHPNRNAIATTSAKQIKRSHSDKKAPVVALNMIELDEMVSSSLLISFVTDVVVARIVLLSTALILATLIFKGGAEEVSVGTDNGDSYEVISNASELELSTVDTSEELPLSESSDALVSSVDTPADIEPVVEVAEVEAQPSTSESKEVFSAVSPPVITAKEKDLIQLRREVSSTIGKKQEKVKQLSIKDTSKTTTVATTVVESTQPMNEDVEDESKPSDTVSVATSQESIDIGTKRIKGRKRRLVTKVIKKVIMPWKSWKSL